MTSATDTTNRQTTTSSLLKLRGFLAEAMTLRSEKKATANWQRAQRMAWGDHHHDSDMQSAGDDMILVDSTVTITVPPEPAAKAPGSAQPSKFGALAKAGIAAALIGSGAGATVGVPLGISALKDLLIQEQPAATAPAAPDSTGGESVTSPRYLLELGKPE